MKGKEDSSSACHGVSGPKAWPETAGGVGRGPQLLGDLVHGGRAFERARCHSEPPAGSPWASHPGVGVSSSI